MRFDEKANWYREDAIIQQDMAKWCAAWIESDCSGKTALEFGAGPGLLTNHLARSGFSQLTATDYAPNMVEIGQNSVPQAHWRCMDAWEPDLFRVDRLYSASLLQWSNDPAAVLKKWRSMLRPGGRLLSCFFIEGSLVEFNEISPDFTALRWRDELEWEALFGSAGYKIERSDTVKSDEWHVSARAALRSLHDIGAIQERRFSLAQLKQFIRQADTRYPDGFPLTWKAMRIEASV